MLCKSTFLQHKKSHYGNVSTLWNNVNTGEQGSGEGEQLHSDMV